MSSNEAGKSAAGQPNDSPSKGKRLRRPHASTQERLRNGEFDQDQQLPPTVIKPSVLSATAPEFVPKISSGVGMTQVTDDVLYQDFQRLVSIRPSHLAGVTTVGTAGKDSPADLFKDAVFQLTSNPGPMEEYLKPVVDLLKRGVNDKEVINEIIDTLFEQSITEANFRFTGAKICKYLSTELKSHHVFSNFRGMYLNRCKVEYDKREDLLKSNVERLCGLSMYFGELFLVLQVEKDGILQKIGLLRTSICTLLDTLLSQIDDTTVKCATQLIKLTGPALMETTTFGGSLDNVFRIIKSLEKHPSLNKTSHCLINSVLSRLECNFGVEQQPDPSRSQTQTQQSYATNYQSEPVFYNTQGQTISREEAGFCQEEGGIEGLNREEEEAFLQFEAEAMASQQGWMESGSGDQPWSSGGIGNDQPWIDSSGDNYPQQAWSSGETDYTPWSSNTYNESGYYPEYSSDPDMDEEMAMAYEMFLKESGQHQQ